MTSATTRDTGATDADKTAILEAALSLAETQILAQNEDEANLDAQAMGLVAFDGALVGAVLAAQERLGKWWWVALIAVTLSASIALKNTPRIARKFAAIRLAVATLFVGLFLAGLLIAFAT